MVVSSAWYSIETTTIGLTHPTLVENNDSHPRFESNAWVEKIFQELTKYASRTKNQYLELKDLKKNVDIQLSRESGFDETF